MSIRFRFRGHGLAVWVRGIQLILLVAGVVLLGFAGFTLTRAHLYQIREGRAFNHTLRQTQASDNHGTASLQSEAKSYIRFRTTSPARGEPIARIEIPRIGLNTLVLEGDDTRTLRLGAGHIPGTSFPGEAGNVAIAGHRDTFFRHLRNIEKNDTITLRTPAGSYNYRVEALRVVTPNDVGVLGPTPDNILTLITCYPFHFVGPAPDRFIVRARQLPTSSYAMEADHKDNAGTKKS